MLYGKHLGGLYRARIHHAPLLARQAAVIDLDDELVPASENPVQRLFANISPLWCLPQGRFGEDNRPVGTVLRAGRLR